MPKLTQEDFNGPKKSVFTAFFFWSNEVRPKVIEQLRAELGAEFRITAVGKKLGEMWKDVDADKRASYDKAVKEAKAEYTVQLEAWQKTADYAEYMKQFANKKQKKENKANAKEAKESGMPSKPASGYMIFSMANMQAVIESLKAKGEKADMKVRAGIIKQKWDALGEAGQKEYDTQYRTAKAQYDIDIKAWNETEAGKKFAQSKAKSSAKAAETKKEAKRAGKPAKSPRAMKKRKLADGSAEPQPEESPADDNEAEESPEEADESPAESEESPVDESPAESEESPTDGA